MEKGLRYFKSEENQGRRKVLCIVVAVIALAWVRKKLKITDKFLNIVFGIVGRFF